jgi:type I restriction enzyme S subunit
MPIVVPPLPEQRRIAAILDHADALRAKRRQVLAHVEALIQSIFNEMFGRRDDPTKRLDELIDADDRVNYGVVQPGDESPGGVPLIRVSNLTGGIVNRTNLKHISPEIEAGYQRSRLRGNEILVSSVGSIGAVSVVRPPDVGSNIARAITRVPISDEVLRTYVAAYLRTPKPQRYFVAELRTVAQPTLNVGQLAATQIPLPPVDLQREFGDRLQLVQDNVEAVLSACDAGDELFASLQSRAFRGEL